MSNPTAQAPAAETAAPKRAATGPQASNNTQSLPFSAIQDIDPLLLSQITNLPHEDQVKFLAEYHSKKKTVMLGYVCWFFLGVHYGYVGKWGMQIAYWLTLGGLGMWAIIDLFRIPGIINTYNREMGTALIPRNMNDFLKNFRVTF